MTLIIYSSSIYLNRLRWDLPPLVPLRSNLNLQNEPKFNVELLDVISWFLIELDEDDETLNISFESFGEEYSWELDAPIINCLVEELQEFSSEYFKSGKLFIDHAAELIPITYLPSELVSELNEEFDTGVSE